MHLDVASLELLADWLDVSDRRLEGDRELILELIDSLEDGTWKTRWYRPPTRDLYVEHGSAQWEVYLREGLSLVITFDYGGEPDIVQVQAIRDSGRGPAGLPREA